MKTARLDAGIRISASTSTRINFFPFSCVCAATTENEIPLRYNTFKHKDIYHTWLLLANESTGSGQITRRLNSVEGSDDFVCACVFVFLIVCLLYLRFTCTDTLTERTNILGNVTYSKTCLRWRDHFRYLDQEFNLSFKVPMKWKTFPSKEEWRFPFWNIFFHFRDIYVFVLCK